MRDSKPANDKSKPMPAGGGSSAGGEDKHWGRGADSALERMRILERAKAEAQARRKRPQSS